VSSRVSIGIPVYDQKIDFRIKHAIDVASLKQKAFKLHFSRSGILPRAFNYLLADALNDRAEGATHFLLWHNDIVPLEPGFLDKMLALMQTHQCDVLSVVSPIKDMRGLTTTALDTHPENPHWVKRLTMKEIYESYPPTWSDEKLLINTGLMLVNMTKPWVENICFNFQETIFKDMKGIYRAAGVSEDWLFSRQAKLLGAKLAVTREISIQHVGYTDFPNTSVWGQLETDNFVPRETPPF